MVAGHKGFKKLWLQSHHFRKIVDQPIVAVQLSFGERWLNNLVNDHIYSQFLHVERWSRGLFMRVVKGCQGLSRVVSEGC
jgi:hypothetical protein